MRLAISGGGSAAPHVVLALGEGSGAVLDVMPATVARQSWPTAEGTERLAALVHQVLGAGVPAIRHSLAPDEARRLSTAFLEESQLPQPQSLHGIICSLPPGMAGQSIGFAFVGRADLLRDIHRLLAEGRGLSARLTSRITAGGGFGKTGLAVEYVHRYGARYYPGGIFWVNAASSDIDVEFWRLLSTLDPNLPDLAIMRKRGRDIRRELERALRRIGQPALYVIDNIPEAPVGTAPPSVGYFCPAVGAVAVLATSRQDTREEGVRRIPVDVLGRDAAILLLTSEVPGAGALSWSEWGRIAEWVGDLPIALDLLNRSLALGSISPGALFERVQLTDQMGGVTSELERLSDALRGQVPDKAVRGVTETFMISFERLGESAQRVAQLLAHLAPAPIPEAFVESLPDEWKKPEIRSVLRSRHFVTSGDALVLGVMHRLIADFLRGTAGTLAPELVEQACVALWKAMAPDRSRDPIQWPEMNLCRPHAEVLSVRGYAIDVTSLASSWVDLRTAILTHAQGDYAAARRFGERGLKVMRRVLGEEHRATLVSMNNLAGTLEAQGEYDGGGVLQERALELRTKVLGEEHLDTLVSMSNLAGIFSSLGQYTAARRLSERVQ